MVSLYKSNDLWNFKEHKKMSINALRLFYTYLLMADLGTFYYEDCDYIEKRIPFVKLENLFNVEIKEEGDFENALSELKQRWYDKKDKKYYRLFEIAKIDYKHKIFVLKISKYFRGYFNYNPIFMSDKWAYRELIRLRFSDIIEFNTVAEINLYEYFIYLRNLIDDSIRIIEEYKMENGDLSEIPLNMYEKIKNIEKIGNNYFIRLTSKEIQDRLDCSNIKYSELKNVIDKVNDSTYLIVEIMKVETDYAGKINTITFNIREKTLKETGAMFINKSMRNKKVVPEPTPNTITFSFDNEDIQHKLSIFF